MWYQSTDKIHLHGLQGWFYVSSSFITVINGYPTCLIHLTSVKTPTAQLALNWLMQEICLQIIGIICPVNTRYFSVFMNYFLMKPQKNYHPYLWRVKLD